MKNINPSRSQLFALGPDNQPKSILSYEDKYAQDIPIFSALNIVSLRI